MPRLRVLIVDDSLTIRAILEEIISASPLCEVVGAASSIAEARELIAVHAPDVVTLDLAMPEHDGLSFLDERSANSHAPFVVISSSTIDRTDATAEALHRGATACFDKSRLTADRAKLIQALLLAAREHLQQRLRRVEHNLKRAGFAT